MRETRKTLFCVETRAIKKHFGVKTFSKIVPPEHYYRAYYTEQNKLFRAKEALEEKALLSHGRKRAGVAFLPDTLSSSKIGNSWLKNESASHFPLLRRK